MEEEQTITITVPVTCATISEEARAQMIDRLAGAVADIVSEHLPEGSVNRDGVVIEGP